MSKFQLSSATLLALLVFAEVAGAQEAQPQTAPPQAPTAAMPATPAMPQVPAPAAPPAPAADEVVATPFGNVSRAVLASPAAAPVHSPKAPPAAKPKDTASKDAKGKTEKAAASALPVVEAPPPAPPVATTPPANLLAPVPPAAASAERPWLREKPKAETPPPLKEEPASPWRWFVALLLVASLGGFAFVARHRRGKTPTLPPSASRIVILSQAKIGPKANAVVAEVAGRVFLLGVTDSSVSRLAVLDTANRPARAARAGALARGRAPRDDLDDETARDAFLKSRRAPVETSDVDDEPVFVPGQAQAQDKPLSSKFGEMLDRALGVRSPAGVPEFRGNAAVAALLASDVEDVVSTHSTRAPRESDALPSARRRGPTITAEIVEDQAAGLSRKRRRA